MRLLFMLSILIALLGLSGCATIRVQTKVLLIRSNQILGSIMDQGQVAIDNGDLQTEEELYSIEDELSEACGQVLKIGNRFFDVATWFDKILAVLSFDKCKKKIKKITEEHPQLVPTEMLRPEINKDIVPAP